MYPTDDQSNGRVHAIVRSRRSHIANSRLNGSRNAAADVIRGQLDAIYSRTEKFAGMKEINTAPFSFQLSSQSDQNSLRCKYVKPQQASAAPQQSTKDSVNHAMRTAPCPNRFSQSHKLAIPLRKWRSNSKKFGRHTQVSADQWKTSLTALSRKYLSGVLHERYYAGDVRQKTVRFSIDEGKSNITPVISRPITLDPQKPWELRS